MIAKPRGIPMREWAASVPNEGVIRFLDFLNQERLLIVGSKALTEVLVTNNYDFQKPYEFRVFLGRILGDGIVLAEGDEHRHQRKSLMPAFASRHIKELYPVFWNKGREVVEAMTDAVISQSSKSEDDTKSAVLEISNWTSRVTLDIIGVAGLGRSFNAIQDESSDLCQAYHTIMAPNIATHVLGFLRLFISNAIVNRIPVKRNDDLTAAVELIRSTAKDLVREKRRKLAASEKGQMDHDILSIAIESGGFSDENLVDQAMTFLAAGHETTASSMTWAVYMLARHPEIQARLRAEIREKLPSLKDARRDITSLEIDRMPYLNAVCSELLRYFAPIPMTMRDAARDTTILGRHVPKGTRIVLCPWATNRDVKEWGPDAHSFNPDRWIPKFDGDKAAANGGGKTKYSLLTFIHGPRGCIGAGFSRAEFACLLATWVGRFDFRLANEEDHDEETLAIFPSGVTARPDKGLHVQCTIVDSCPIKNYPIPEIWKQLESGVMMKATYGTQ
ncbi:hypothetical protein G7054_g8360 [Neopestalotiopsis clavispora]|nr:hypothetical protein G7054_g8360 [Neopestalotiopsis clavispora]